MAALDGASSSPAVSTTVPSSFDVFLSFRGEDTRRNFVSFLHKALKDRGINVFVDSEKQWIGGAIGPTLHKAIKGSKISILVISKGYVDSKWCLRELALIVQCYRSNGQLVLPIFYYVAPSDIRHQAGSFRKALEKHEKNVKLKPDIIKEWRDALKTVGNMMGEVVDETKDQAELVESVVKRITDELISNTHLAVCKYPIGIDSPITDLLSRLNIGSNDIQFVGICGFGGIGKTTIAKVVYNRILETFNKHSFLSDVREHATQCSGLVCLQKRLLKDILKTDIDIANVHKGTKIIGERLRKEKVLVILDDVDSREQVEALAGKDTWFGEGSRVIITTRNEDILKQVKVDKIYRPQVLDYHKSLQLFSLHAFSDDNPPKDYMQLSQKVARYSGGLPLTLEVLGSYLSNISEKEVWENTLQNLKEIPNEEVQRRLKISYDNLKDYYHKEIFLDVACFFIGWEVDIVISIWKSCGYYPISIMHTLIKRSLLKLEKDLWNGKSKLRMHDQIRDMGREIVREENPLEPSKRSRLWSYSDILDVLEEHKETDMIKGMILHHDVRVVKELFEPLWNFDSGDIVERRDFCLESKHFEMMSNVRFLDISNANFMGEFSCIPSTLRWLRWRNCPWVIVPANFYNKRLVYLDLSRSNIKQAWNVGPQDENKCFEKLEVLNLRECVYLSKSLEFSWFPCLEQLDLGYCKSLEMLDQSIGKLIRLKSLILDGCISLKELPDGVGLLEKLEVVVANYCYSLVRLPDLSRLKNLTTLVLRDCVKLEELQGLEETESLEELDALGCYNMTRSRRKILGQGKLLDWQPVHDYYPLIAGDGIYGNNMGSLILCIVFDPDFIHYYSHGDDIHLSITASIRQKGKPIICSHELKIEGVELGSAQDIIYIHYFKGFDWFGIPLQDNDPIEILDICELREFDEVEQLRKELEGYEEFLERFDQRKNCLPHFPENKEVEKLLPYHLPKKGGKNVKLWKLWYENKEPYIYQQKPDHYWNTCPFRDYFDWSRAYEASPSGGWSCVYKTYNTEEEIFLGLSSRCWSSHSVPKEKEEQEQGVLNKGALCPSHTLALTLPCGVMSLDDCPNQQTQVDQLSHVHENGKTSPPSLDTEEEEEEDQERNNPTKDPLNCVGFFDSVSDVVEKEGGMLRPGKRARLHDNNDEGPGPSLSLNFKYIL